METRESPRAARVYEREHTYDAFEEEGHGGEAVHVHDASEHREGREMAELGGEEGASTEV